MNAVTTLWSAVAGGALTMAGAHAALWLMDRRARANLAFGIVALGVAGIAITELGMMHAASAAEYGRWVRWFHLPNAAAVIGLVAFVQLQFGSGRLWLAGVVVGMRTLVLALNFTLGGFYEDGQLYDRVRFIRNTAYGFLSPGIVGANILNDHRSTTVDITTYSAFGQLRYKLSDQLELSGGVRWTDETREETVIDICNLVAGQCTSPVDITPTLKRPPARCTAWTHAARWAAPRPTRR